MATHPGDSKPSSNRYFSLDIIKAIAIILVVIWHTKPIVFLNIETNTSFLVKALNKISLLFYFEISLLAVPSFFIVSLYIFFLKSSNNNQLPYLKKRLIRISQVFFVWSIVQFSIFFLTTGVLVNGEISQFHWLPFESPLQLLKMGGPSLPKVGDSVFYFLFNLMLLVTICSTFSILRNKFSKHINYFIFSLLPISLIGFEISSFLGYNVPYHSILNFIVYIPITYFLSFLEPQKIKKEYATIKYLGIMGTLFLLLIYKNEVWGYTSIYARSSLVIGSVLLFLVALKIADLRFCIKYKSFWLFFSTHSLGIFAIHKYWQYVILSITENYRYREQFVFFNLQIQNLLFFLLIIFLTSFTCFFLGRSKFLMKYVK
ncbi:acyltransferase family protein [Nodularia sp. UHCC 0506]|uniref:acyltransferase family protein n=1 Tax=Nodularia sp. UHCC 0506 TaxID=3110243 RepID=UPI002B20ED49|nr:acyltransferase family protein [Nodularia sp. UHCC 0506]MEA5516401.1 acyltransferase family protein [Nodularia sp. UHCC 0506]